MSVLLSLLDKCIFDFFSLCFKILPRTCSVGIFFLFLKANRKKNSWYKGEMFSNDEHVRECIYILLCALHGPSFCWWRAVPHHHQFSHLLFTFWIIRYGINVAVFHKRKINTVTEWRSNLSIYLFGFFTVAL